MKFSKTLVWLSSLVALLALIATCVGLFAKGGSGPFTFTTLRGSTVQMYGQGLYRNDSLLTASTFLGADIITLFISIPALIACLLLYRRGSLRGGLLLAGMLCYFLYNSASLAFSAAYNNLFLVYIAYFSASLFALILAFSLVDRPALPARISPHMPSRGTAIFFLVAGTGVFSAWMSGLIGPLLNGQAPLELGSSTTVVTHVLDMGIIAPVCWLAGIQLLRRAPLGYLLGLPMMILCSLIGLVIISQTAVQIQLGIVLTVGQMIVYVVSFLTMSLFAAGLSARFLRNIIELAPAQPAKTAA